MAHHTRTRQPAAALLLLVVLLLVALLLSPTHASADATGQVLDMDYQPQERPVGQHRCGYDEMMQSRKERLGAAAAAANAVAAVTYRNSTGSGSGLLDRARSLLSLTSRVSSGSATWQPLRISVFTEDLNDDANYCTAAGQSRPDYSGGTMNCTANQVLTAAKKRLLVDTIVPAAIQLHEERLLVQPVEHIQVAPHTRWDDFHVPESHLTDGVSGTDFVLYLAAGPTGNNTVAWAATAQLDLTTGRPLVGVANISPEYIQNSTYTIRVLAHELLHALGFNMKSFQTYTTHSDGSENAVRSVSDLRGKPYDVPVLTSPSALAAAKDQYGCPTMQYVELEDQGSSGSAGSHWKMRNAKDELMSPIAGAGIYTAMTIAVMEDLGFYKGNYDKAEEMTWGKGAGCSLFSSKCIVDEASTQPSMFCASEGSSHVCPSTRLALGHCRINTYTSSLPSYFQYFSDPMRGGATAFMDYCPVYEAYSNTHCDNGDPNFMPGSVISPSARCLDAATWAGITVDGYRQPATALCVDVKCSTTGKSYQIRVKGSSTFVDCPAGSRVSPSSTSNDFGSGSLLCPLYAEVCNQNFGGEYGSDGASTMELNTVAHFASLIAVMLSLLLVAA